MIEQTRSSHCSFVQAMTAAPGAALSLALLPQRAAGQSPPKSPGSDQFETAEIKTDDNTIFIRRYGNGSPLLLVHGFPRSASDRQDEIQYLQQGVTVIEGPMRLMKEARAIQREPSCAPAKQ
jgi:haloacetate dehalogenase